MRQPLLKALHIGGCGLILLPLATIAAFHSDAAPASARLGLGAVSGVLHASIYLVLLVFFASGLGAGRQPCITALARQMRDGDLPPELERYTRKLTWFWVGFCAAQILASLLLLAFASPAIWSLFVSVLNLPLILVAIAGEYLYRRLRYRQYEHETAADFARMLHHLKAVLRPW